MDYQIRKAAGEDLPRILRIYENARAFMAQRGNPSQWGSNRPGRETLEEDIRKQRLYVLEGEGELRGVFALISGRDPTYDVIYDGAWGWDSPYAAIHRVAGDGSGGIFRAVMAFAAAQWGHLRIDTHRQNLPMQRAVEQAGFQYRGIILTDDGTERLAYDWKQ